LVDEAVSPRRFLVMLLTGFALLPNFPAAWCERLQSSAEALQTHTLPCVKKPLTISAVSSASEGPPVNAENRVGGAGRLGVLAEKLARRAMK
jgi:hypothetical protein